MNIRKRMKESRGNGRKKKPGEERGFVGNNLNFWIEITQNSFCRLDLRGVGVRECREEKKEGES